MEGSRGYERQIIAPIEERLCSVIHSERGKGERQRGAKEKRGTERDVSLRIKRS